MRFLNAKVSLSGPATQIGQTQVRKSQSHISELYNVPEDEVQAEQPSAGKSGRNSGWAAS